MEVVAKHEKYLGLPSMIGKSKKEAFAHLRDRVCKYLQGWKEKWLSKGGKEILIKAVIQAIPTYAMSCFKLPQYFTDDIERLMAKFWWEDSQGKGIHWARWNELCICKDFGGLGFRDLRAFNSALLAKQVWRLLVSPHSLLARIYKAKYYPHSDILSATLGSNSSYTWRSIWSAIGLVEKGTRWRIGNGHKVRIWGDKWLPRASTFKVYTPRGSWPSDMTVQTLIDSSVNQWNVDLISSIFNEEDTRCILSIPIGSARNEDIIVWHYNRNGIFSVRGAYHIAVQMEKDKSGRTESSSSSLAGSNAWKWLWSLQLPSKIKIFIWRSCKNILPTRQNLAKRKIIEVRSCDICSGQEEDVLHCLVSCTFARQVWALSGIPWSIHRSDDSSFLDWLMRVKKQTDGAQFEFCVVVCWANWYTRNKKYFENLNWWAYDTVQLANKFILEVRGSAAEVLRSRVVRKTSRIAVRWEAPIGEVIKINFDASINSTESGCGLGGLARSSDGRCLGWFSVCCKQHLDPTSAEAMAALKALEFARDHQFTKVFLESDSSTVVTAVEEEGNSRMSYGNILADIRHLATSFEIFKIGHVLREGNRPAHEIAKLSRSSSYQLTSLPSFIR